MKNSKEILHTTDYLLVLPYNKPTNNGTIYYKDNLDDVLNKYKRNTKLVGRLVLSPGTTIPRITKKEVACIVEDVDSREDGLYAKISILDNTHGRVIMNNINNRKSGFSASVIGTIKKYNNNYIVHVTKIVSIDFVPFRSF